MLHWVASDDVRARAQACGARAMLKRATRGPGLCAYENLPQVTHLLLGEVLEAGAIFACRLTYWLREARLRAALGARASLRLRHDDWQGDLGRPVCKSGRLVGLGPHA